MGTFDIVVALEEGHENGFGGFGFVGECFGADFESADLGRTDVMFSEEIVDDCIRGQIPVRAMELTSSKG